MAILYPASLANLTILCYYKLHIGMIWCNHHYIIPWLPMPWLLASPAGSRPTNNILMEFEIRPKYEVLWFKMFSTDRNEILHTARQCNHPDVCKTLLWSVEHKLQYSKSLSNFKFDQNAVCGMGGGGGGGGAGAWGSAWDCHLPGREFNWALVQGSSKVHTFSSLFWSALPV